MTANSILVDSGRSVPYKTTQNRRKDITPFDMYMGECLSLIHGGVFSDGDVALCLHSLFVQHQNH